VVNPRRFAVAITLILLTPVAGGACADKPARACPQNTSAESVGLCIEDVTATVITDNTVSLHAWISNTLSRGLKGKVWWVLAPLGPGQPWDRAIFLSRVDERDYTPGATVRLAWTTTVALPGAFYDLAVVAHRINVDSSETHSDAQFVAPLHFGAPLTHPWLIRRNEGQGPAVIISASDPQPGSGGPNPLSRTVTMTNLSSTGTAVSVRIEERALLAGWEDRWWAGPTLYSTSPSTTNVAAGSTVTLRLDSVAPRSLLASFPTAQVWLVATVGAAIADQTLLGGLDTFQRRSSIRLTRRGPPSGPVELTGIGDTATWNHAVPNRVALSVSNLTGTNQAVEGWWYLAVPGDLHPWLDPSAIGVLARFTLGPWASTSVAVGAYKIPTAGQWELSAWIHYEESTGAFTQTDALLLAEPVTVS
jgi:hypothetical protein